MNNILPVSLFLLALVSCNSVKEKGSEVERLPNIIHIFADDLGKTNNDPNTSVYRKNLERVQQK